MQDDIRIIEWDFNPYRPVRDDITGEVVFIKKWQNLMIGKSAPNLHIPVTDDAPRPHGTVRLDQYFVENPEYEDEFPVMHVWRDYGIPTAHDTRMMSNLIVWLGTNAGYVMRDTAQNLIKHGTDPKHAYLMSWHISNIRERGINHNSIYRDTLATKFEAKTNPPTQPTAFDLETIEHVCLWLGTERGQKYLHSCEHNIQIKQDREHAQRTGKPLKQNNIIK